MLTLVCGDTKRHKGPIDRSQFSEREGMSQLDLFEKGRSFAQQGVTEDIVIATNNDHVFNGIRVAVAQGVLKPENVTILFYRYDIDQVDGPKMYRGGRIDYWPKGFFNQWDNALDILLDLHQT